MKKKIFITAAAFLATLSILLSGCSGTPKPPVKTALNLSKLLQNGQTINQVYALMTDSLKTASTLYQANLVETSASGGWVFHAKEGGYAVGETDTYQVLFIHAAKTGGDVFLIFFKSNSEFGSSWFNAQNAVIVETALQGKNIAGVTNTTTIVH